MYSQIFLLLISDFHILRRVGYFVQPTIVVTKNPVNKIMTEEIFGPVLTVYVYKDSEIDATMKLIETSTPYALTGAIFAQDEWVQPFYSIFSSKFMFLICGFRWNRSFLKDAFTKLKYTAGNFYINDKSTGSVVAQQPFGGSRLSGWWFFLGFFWLELVSRAFNFQEPTIKLVGLTTFCVGRLLNPLKKLSCNWKV